MPPEAQPAAAKPSLVRKLAQVMQEVERIPKSGFNAHFRYKFAQEGDVLEAIRGHLAKKNIMLFPDVVEDSQAGDVTRLKVAFRFVDGDTGEEQTFHAIGLGKDTQDKGASKAYTAAVKYGLLKVFLIPTGDDPDEAGAAADPQAAQKDLKRAGGDFRTADRHPPAPAPTVPTWPRPTHDGGRATPPPDALRPVQEGTADELRAVSGELSSLGHPYEGDIPASEASAQGLLAQLRAQAFDLKQAQARAAPAKAAAAAPAAVIPPKAPAAPSEIDAMPIADVRSELRVLAKRLADHGRPVTAAAPKTEAEARTLLKAMRKNVATVEAGKGR